MQKFARFSFAILLALTSATLLLADDDASKKAKQETQGEAKAKSEKKNKPAEYIRVRKNEKGRSQAMETAISHFKGKNSKGEEIQVDLIGVVHIGEKDYYEQLNKLFEKYDVVLYELVAPEGTVVPKGGRGEGEGANPLSLVQTSMKDALALEFQLEHIDYTKENFRHADMSPEEFLESMNENNESFAGMFFKMIGASMAAQNSKNAPNDTEMLFALMSPDREYRLRKMMAEQMKNSDVAMAAFGGKEGSTIIHKRNGKAFEVMEKEIKNGKKKIAIFYGAGHLEDMHERLEKDYKMKETGERDWLTAWRLVRPSLGAKK